MTDARALQADFADYKRIKSRKIFQIIMEVPIEREMEVLKTLGTPNVETGNPVAIAKLNPAAGSTDSGGESSQTNDEQGQQTRRPFHQMRPSQQAALKLTTYEFQSWLGVPSMWAGSLEGRKTGDDLLKTKLGIQSKKELDTNPEKGEAWQALLTDFEVRDMKR